MSQERVEFPIYNLTPYNSHQFYGSQDTVTSDQLNMIWRCQQTPSGSKFTIMILQTKRITACIVQVLWRIHPWSAKETAGGGGLLGSQMQNFFVLVICQPLGPSMCITSTEAHTAVTVEKFHSIGLMESFCMWPDSISNLLFFLQKLAGTSCLSLHLWTHNITHNHVSFWDDQLSSWNWN